MADAPREITIKIVPLWRYIEEECPDNRNLHEAIGSFVWLCGLLEVEINDLVQHYIKISRRRLNILLGQQRTDNGLDILNRIKSSGLVPLSDTDNFEETVRHLREINRLRNDLIHHEKLDGIAPRHITVSNEYFTRPNNTSSVRVISGKTIKDAEIDLAMLAERIYLLGEGSGSRRFA